MSQEHVYADYVTVRAGDLPILAARSLDDLPQLDRVASQLDLDVLRTTQHVSQRVDVLRRRHQLLSSFVDDLARDLPTETGRPVPAADVTALELRLVRLRNELAQLPLDVEVNHGGDLARDRLAPGERAVTRTASTDVTASELHAADRRVQLRVVVGWERDGQQVTLGVDGWDHDRAERVDLGGLHAALDWTAANLLLRKLRVGRDRSCGVPE